METQQTTRHWSTCPSCGSPDAARRASGIVAEGTHTGSYRGRSRGWSWGGGGLAGVSGRSRGTISHRSELAARLGPPALVPRSAVRPFLLAAGVLIVVAGLGVPLPGFLPVLAVVLLAARQLGRLPRALHQRAMWAQLCYCARCDGVFRADLGGDLYPLSAVGDALMLPAPGDPR